MRRMPHILFIMDSNCDPGGIQTHDLQNRNLMLYSAKLQGQNSIASAKIAIIYKETIAELTKKQIVLCLLLAFLKQKRYLCQ